MSQNNEISDSKWSFLLDMCKTRWCESEVSYERFYLTMSYIMEALEVMSGKHADINQFDETFSKEWSAKDKQEVSSYLHALSNFNFIIGLISLYRLMHPFTGITKKLQGRSIDVVKAFNEVESVVNDLGAVRSNIDSEFDTICNQAMRMAERMNVTPSTPRMAQRQMHQDNIEAANPQEYYKRVIVIPILNTLILEMKFLFNKFSITVSKVLYLVPELICSQSDIVTKLAPVIVMYKADLINPDIADQEITLWMKKCEGVQKSQRGYTLATAIKECDEDHFPNIFVLLKVACTLLITSCECERSFSAIRRHRTWLRSTMKTERLTALTIMNVHRKAEVDYEKVVQQFLRLHPRKLDESNLIYQLMFCILLVYIFSYFRLHTFFEVHSFL